MDRKELINKFAEECIDYVKKVEKTNPELIRQAENRYLRKNQNQQKNRSDRGAEGEGE